MTTRPPPINESVFWCVASANQFQILLSQFIEITRSGVNTHEHKRYKRVRQVGSGLGGVRSLWLRPMSISATPVRLLYELDLIQYGGQKNGDIHVVVKGRRLQRLFTGGVSEDSAGLPGLVPKASDAGQIQRR